jgi:hypothetical protein
MADALPRSGADKDQDRGRHYVIGAGTVFLIVLGIPLYAEFHVSGNTAWNIFLILFLAGIAVAGFLLQRFFLDHAGEIGEARFDTRNKSDADG